ncbi:MAG: hypothetical protein V5B36_01025 [Candidatus Accumulibacter sp. UW25]
MPIGEGAWVRSAARPLSGLARCRTRLTTGERRTRLRRRVGSAHHDKAPDRPRRLKSPHKILIYCMARLLLCTISSFLPLAVVEVHR